MDEWTSVNTPMVTHNPQSQMRHGEEKVEVGRERSLVLGMLSGRYLWTV